jgi:hypothetical protein
LRSGSKTDNFVQRVGKRSSVAAENSENSRANPCRGEAADAVLDFARCCASIRPCGPRVWLEGLDQLSDLTLVKGKLASLLWFAQNAKRPSPSEIDELERTVSLVAGARNQRYLQLWGGVA